MKKLFFVLFMSLILFGCDGVEEGIIDSNIVDLSVTEIDAPSSLVYSGLDTKLNTSITFSNSESLLRVWINIASQDGKISITNDMDMTESSENRYSTLVDMNTEMPSIVYTIDFFYETENQAEKKIASHNFTYDNLQDNISPEISFPFFYYLGEQPTLRDTLENDKEFIISIDVFDENGINDIDSVYTDFYSPNNPSAKRFLLFDDGNSNHGDAIAGDGIYSLKNIFSNASGERKFEFWARDRRGALSNMITHIVVVK